MEELIQACTGSGSISQRHDLHQNVMDPEHFLPDPQIRGPDLWIQIRDRETNQLGMNRLLPGHFCGY
jgi:hypothetical protein